MSFLPLLPRQYEVERRMSSSTSKIAIRRKKAKNGTVTKKKNAIVRALTSDDEADLSEDLSQAGLSTEEADVSEDAESIANDRESIVSSDDKDLSSGESDIESDDVNALNEVGQTPLCRSLLEKNSTEVDRLLERPEVDVSVMCKDDDCDFLVGQETTGTALDWLVVRSLCPSGDIDDIGWAGNCITKIVRREVQRLKLSEELKQNILSPFAISSVVDEIDGELHAVMDEQPWNFAEAFRNQRNVLKLLSEFVNEWGDPSKFDFADLADDELAELEEAEELAADIPPEHRRHGLFGW